MDNSNSLRLIWGALARSGSYKQYITESDIETFDRRFTSEGIEFYGRQLAALRTSLFRGLEQHSGLEIDDAVCRFKRMTGTRLPVFMYNAWKAIFNHDGSLRERADAGAVSCINQLTAVFTKLEGGHSVSSELDALLSFKFTEAELQELWHSHLGELIMTRWGQEPTALAVDNWNEWADHNMGRDSIAFCDAAFILEMASKLVHRVFSNVDPRDILPRHGSGASACGTRLAERYGKPRFVEKIHRLWPYDQFYALGPDHYEEWLGSEGFELETYNPRAKVLIVPKDVRGPRLISCEPRETMWIQQGLMDKMVSVLEHAPLTRGLVNFRDQTVNQLFAYAGSITGTWATLDLKDASDRVTMPLVQALFPANWVEALAAARSESTLCPDGSTVTLFKHAPMGSATCFPVMATCLWAILTAAYIIDGRLESRGCTTNVDQYMAKVRKYRDGLEKPNPWLDPDQARHTSCDKVRGASLPRIPVFVYGDDIICPSGTFARSATRVLEAFGLKVNRNKSFGLEGIPGFRESCGKEYFKGFDVTPIRLRTVPDDDPKSQLRLYAFHNNLYKRTGRQPLWLTDLIMARYPHTPQRSVRYHGQDPCAPNLEGALGIPALWTGIPGSEDTWDSVNCTLDVYRAEQPATIRKRWIRHLYRWQYRILTVVPQQTSYDTDDWSQVFRAVVNPRREQPLGFDALPKRVSYKYRWVYLD